MNFKGHRVLKKRFFLILGLIVFITKKYFNFQPKGSR